MAESPHYERLARMYHSAPINTFYDPSLEIREGEADVAIDVEPKLFHAAGAVHGSVYFKLLDDAAFFAVQSLVDDMFVVTASFNTYLTRPVTGGHLVARGRVVHRARRLMVAEAELYDEKERVVGRGSGTFMRSGIPLSAEVGYD